MEIMRRMWKSKQYREVAKPCLISQWRNWFSFSSPNRCECASGYNGTHYGTCISLLEAHSDGLLYRNDSSLESHEKPPTPTPTPDSSLDAETLYYRLCDSIVEQYDEVPAGMLLAMIQRCRTHYDINLLIFFLQEHPCLLDPHLTEEITRACLRSGALPYAQTTLCKVNSYGFVPNLGSALLFMSYAKEHGDIKLMDETIRLVRINNLPLTHDAAEIILKTYRKRKETELFIPAVRRFISTGVKLNQSSLEMSMEFAANMGDADFVQVLERVRSQVMTRHTCKSGFAYAKSFLLDRKPEEAAKVILDLLAQYLPVVDDDPRIIHDIEFYRRKGELWPDELMKEIKKMVKEWPAKIVKIRISRIIKKERIATFKSCIPKMVEYLSTKGLLLDLDMDHLNQLGNSL